MLTRERIVKERIVQLQAQIKRMIVRKEYIFLKLDDLSDFKLAMFYVALCIDQEESRRLDYIEEKIQNYNGHDLSLLVQIYKRPTFIDLR
jgi:hypothetical protein